MSEQQEQQPEPLAAAPEETAPEEAAATEPTESVFTIRLTPEGVFTALSGKDVSFVELFGMIELGKAQLLERMAAVALQERMAGAGKRIQVAGSLPAGLDSFLGQPQQRRRRA